VIVNQDPLLSTKLYIPRDPVYLVSRDRLLAKLARTLTSKLTVVTAPPGFGKTTLVGDWIRKQCVAAAWVSLDQGENDALRFWKYVIAAFDGLMPGVGKKARSLLQPSVAFSVEQMVAWLLNDLFEVQDEMVLVLDDYHVIENEEVHRSLLFFLERLPEQVHVCLISRKDPPFPIGRLRAKGQCLQIEISEIKFTMEEISAYWSLQAEGPPSQETLRLLAQRTEGWIAGLQLAMLSQSAGQGVKLRDFTGNHRYVADYLMEEVFAHLPERVQAFLLKTSILERMTGGLCAAVTGMDEAEALLEEIEQAHLFLIPLDGHRYWFRYHQLFADFLRSRLAKESGEAMADLHRRASGWFEAQGFLEEAIHHALAGGAFERGALLLEQNATALLTGRELVRLSGWLRQLPAEIVRRPEMLIILGWTDLQLHRYDDVERHLGDLKASLLELERAQDGLLVRMQEEVVILENFYSLMKGDYERSLALVQALYARDDLPDSGGLGLLLNFGIELNEGTIPFIRGYYGVNGRVRLSWPHQQVYDKFIAKNGLFQFAFTAYQGVAMSELLYERNELAAAAKYAEEGIALAVKFGLTGAYLPAVIVRAKVLTATGDVAAAMESVREAAVYLEENDLVQTHWHGLLTAYLVRCQLAADGGDRAAVEKWWASQQGHVEEELLQNREFETLTLIQVLIAKGDVQEALRWTERLRKTARQTERVMTELEACLCLAEIYALMGEAHASLIHLHRALEIGEREEYLRTLADRAGEMPGVFRQYAEMRKKRQIPELQNGVSRGYLAVVISTAGVQIEKAGGARAEYAAVHALTARELEVLQLTAKGLTNKEIAEKLFLTEGTVKLHLHRVYSKLQVKGRVQATQKAKQNGLLR